MDTVTDLKKKLMKNDIIMAFFGVGGLVIAAIEYEVFLKRSDSKERFEETVTNTVLRLIVSFLTLIVCSLATKHSLISYNIW